MSETLYRGGWPVELNSPPSMWVRPGGRPTVVVLPYGGNKSANVLWLKEVNPDRRLTVRKSGRIGWEFTRSRTDEVRAAMVRKFGFLTVVIDVSTQQFCTTSCQSAKATTALQCACSCGGENHAGGGTGWLAVNDLLISTTYRRRVWRIT